MDGFTLWLKDGDIVINEDGKPVLCDACPCGMVIDITCPQALHTLGEANPYYVTVTYPVPSTDNKLPAMSLDYSPGEIHPGMAVAVAPGYSSNLEWSGEPGDKTRTLGPVYIRATGAISEEHGRTGTVTLTAWDPDLVDKDGEPLYPVACSFPVYDEVSCSITGPAANVCAGDGFDIRIELTGQGAVSLERMDDDNEAMPVNRFLISWLNLDMVDVESGWANGVWTASGAGVEAPGAAYIRLDEFGEEICRKNLTGKECGVSDIQADCPESLHTLGGDGELRVTATYTDIGLYSVPPDVRILDEDGNDARYLLIDTATGWPPVFTQGWATIGGTRVWSGNLRVDSVPSTTRGMGLVVEASHPRHTDNSGDVIRVECDLAINDLIKCDSMSITAFGKGGCVGDAFGIDALLTGTLGEVLTRMDSPDTGLFGPHGRFRVTVTGDWSITSGGTSLNETWLDGAYTSPALRIEEGDGSLADIKATIKEHVDEAATVLCEDTLSPKECGVDASVSCPSSLHVYGPAKRLRIAFEYTDELYTPSLDIAMYRTVDGVTTPVGFPYPFVMEHPSGSTEPIDFSADEWVTEGMDKVWEHDIRINTLMEEREAIRIDVWAPWKDQAGDTVVLATCAMTFHQLVRCDGGVDMPEECCVDETVGATITVKGSNGDQLPRMDGNMAPRFTISVTGGGSAILPLDFNKSAAWDEGVWRCPSITPNDVDASPVTIELNDRLADDPLCSGEMDVVECGFTAAVSCPQALHTLGPAGTLTITLIYENPSLRRDAPSIAILMADPGDPIETLLDSGTDVALSFAGWPDSGNWVDEGATVTYTADIRVDNVAHEDGTTAVRVEVRGLDKDGASVVLGYCRIDLSEVTECSVTLPQDQCQGEGTHSLSMHVWGYPNGDTLTRFSPTPYGRFEITTSGLTLPPGASLYGEAWSNGQLTINGITASLGECSAEIYDYAYPDTGCFDSFTTYDCEMSAGLTGCPSSLHSLGAGAQITITATYASYAFYSKAATIQVTGPVTWSPGAWSGNSAAGTKTLTGTLTGNLNAEGMASLSVLHPDTGDLLAKCDLDVVNGVVCEIVFDPPEDCPDEPVTVAVLMEGDGGEELTRLPQGAGRFTVSYDGLSGTVTEEGWSSDGYTATLNPQGAQSPITVTVNDLLNEEDVCSDEYVPERCGELAWVVAVGANVTYGVNIQYNSSSGPGWISWGDGSDPQQVGASGTGLKRVAVSHKYTLAGNYEIQVSGPVTSFGHSSAYTSFPVRVVDMSLKTYEGSLASNTSYLGFSSCKNLTEISAGCQFGKSFWCGYRMFWNCPSLVSVPQAITLKGAGAGAQGKGFDLSYMFGYCTALVSPPGISFPSSTTGDMVLYSMFQDSGIASLPSMSFPATIQGNADFRKMFYWCPAILTGGTFTFPGNITGNLQAERMFESAGGATAPSLSFPQTGGYMSIPHVFRYCTDLVNGPASASFQGTVGGYMDCSMFFFGCSNMVTASAGWVFPTSVGGYFDGSSMFGGCVELVTGPSSMVFPQYVGGDMDAYAVMNDCCKLVTGPSSVVFPSGEVNGNCDISQFFAGCYAMTSGPTEIRFDASEVAGYLSCDYLMRYCRALLNAPAVSLPEHIEGYLSCLQMFHQCESIPSLPSITFPIEVGGDCNCNHLFWRCFAAETSLDVLFPEYIGGNMLCNSLFSQCDALVTAPSLFFPSEVGGYFHGEDIMYDLPSLVTGPLTVVLPETTGAYCDCRYLTASCSKMTSAFSDGLILPREVGGYFKITRALYGCSSLVTGPPSLSFPKVENGYLDCSEMFCGCSKLTTGPQTISYPSSVVGAFDCRGTFYGCSKLGNVPSIPRLPSASSIEVSKFFSGVNRYKKAYSWFYDESVCRLIEDTDARRDCASNLYYDCDNWEPAGTYPSVFFSSRPGDLLGCSNMGSATGFMADYPDWNCGAGP